MGARLGAHSGESLSRLEADEGFELIDTGLVFLCRHLTEGGAGPVGDNGVVRAASAQDRVVEGVDQVQTNLDCQRLIEPGQREVTLYGGIELVEEVAAQIVEPDGERTELILRSVEPRLLAGRGAAA